MRQLITACVGRNKSETAAVTLPVWQVTSLITMVIVFSVLYVPITVYLAIYRPLWNDELFTLYISALPSNRLWQALLTAADQNPPPFYWVTHFSLKLFGNSPFALRFPEIAGFWLMGSSLILFVARRLPPVYGLFAALIALVSGAYAYSYEARPYGMIVGLGALALLSWQRSFDRHLGRWWLVSLSACLAMAVSAHYYGALLFIPFAAVEIVTAKQRQFRWSGWIALLCSALPLIAYLPLMQSASAYGSAFWARPQLGSLGQFIIVILGPAALPLGLITVWIGIEMLSGNRLARSIEQEGLIPRAEQMVILAYMAIPIMAILLGKAVTGAYADRYALAATVGISVFCAWIVSMVFQAKSTPALLLSALLGVLFLAKEVSQYRSHATFHDRTSIIHFLQDHAHAHFPVAISDPHMFFELSHQAPSELRQQLFYVADPKLALKYLLTDAVDRSLIDISQWASLRVSTLSGTLGSREPFLIYGHPSTWEWLVPELSSIRLPMSVIGCFEGRLLLLAEPGKVAN